MPRVPKEETTNAPIASFSRHNGGWSVVFSFADPTLGVSWRMAGNGDFRETGFIDTLDPRTRKRMPNPSIELPPDAQAGTIEVRYVDQSGDMQGPFPIRFDPEAALIRDQRKILDMTATSWLSFREFNGLLVYYTHLVSYRCAIREVRIGIDTAVPNQVLKMPGCDMRDPARSRRHAALHEARAGNAVHLGGADLSRRQRVGDQELPHREPQQQLSVSTVPRRRAIAAMQADARSRSRSTPRKVGRETRYLAAHRSRKVRCCIVGGGPAGMMLGYLLGAPASMSWCWRSTPISFATSAATPCIPRRFR